MELKIVLALLRGKLSLVGQIRKNDPNYIKLDTEVRSITESLLSTGIPNHQQRQQLKQLRAKWIALQGVPK